MVGLELGFEQGVKHAYVWLTSLKATSTKSAGFRWFPNTPGFWHVWRTCGSLTVGNTNAFMGSCIREPQTRSSNQLCQAFGSTGAASEAYKLSCIISVSVSWWQRIPEAQFRMLQPPCALRLASFHFACGNLEMPAQRYKQSRQARPRKQSRTHIRPSLCILLQNGNS